MIVPDDIPPVPTVRRPARLPEPSPAKIAHCLEVLNEARDRAIATGHVDMRCLAAKAKRELTAELHVEAHQEAVEASLAKRIATGGLYSHGSGSGMKNTNRRFF